jgi:hypothetical protein
MNYAGVKKFQVPDFNPGLGPYYVSPRGQIYDLRVLARETLWVHDEFCACAGTDFRDLESRGWIKIGGTQVVWEYGRAPKAGRERAYDYLTRNGLRIDDWMLD